MNKVKAWIEAMRLRTLPVSVAGVTCAWAYAGMADDCRLLPGVLCLLFAVLAQIASNFANEYYDFKGGLDRAGREGPRRGVTEGDITPSAMRNATFGVLGAACVTGCTLLHWGGAWLVAVGVFIAVGVVAYSAGPYPLSHHGLGEIAVVFFFGIVPVNMTYYLMCGTFATEVLYASLTMGLMGANVLIVNNYRDYDDDKTVGKNTLCVMLGRKAMAVLYVINGLVAAALTPGFRQTSACGWIAIPIAYVALHVVLSAALFRNRGKRLNSLLGMTAMLMLLYAGALLCASILSNNN